MICGDLNLLNNIGLLCEKKIVLYGAGYFGKRAFFMLKDSMGILPYCFCETDTDGWIKRNNSNTYLGIEVRSIEQIKRNSLVDDLMIIVATDIRLSDEIINVLGDKYSELKEFYTWFGLWFSIGLNIKDDRIIPEYREEFVLRNRIDEKCTKLNYGRHQIDRLYNDSVLIYQPGKVGSQSIEASLNYFGINNAHIHNFRTNGLLEDDCTYDDIKANYQLWVRTYPNKNKIKIITMVREPIARSISLYFMCFSGETICNYPMLAEHKGRILIPDTYKGVRELIDEHARYGQYGEEFEWFNEELKAVFGIDVYEYPFDKDKGYTIIQKGNIEVLVMTLEKMNDNESVIGDYVGVENFKIHNANVGDEKAYKYAYRQLVKEIRIDEKILDFYYNSNKCVEHFYTQEQIVKFKEKWLRMG